MAEESLAFYALVITVLIAAGYDALTGAAVVLLGCGIGTLGSTINPFATGIASGIAGIPISEGLVGRLVILIAGLAIGLAGSFAAVQALTSLLFGVAARDLTTFTVAAMLLVATAVIACLVPSIRATRVDPVVALRAE